MFRQYIFLLTVFLGLFLFQHAAAQTDDDIHFFDPDFVFDVVDPGFCQVPPLSAISDKEIIEMLNSRRDEVPLKGEMKGAINGTIYGDGSYKIHSDGLTASFSNMFILQDEKILSLCMVILPVNDTDLIEGTATLVGPAPESVHDQTYLAITRLSERDESGLKTVGELIGGSGQITFSLTEEGVFNGNLELDGRIEGISAENQIDIQLSFVFEDLIENPLRNLRWTLD